ncbi:MAG TPA: exonuclease SbcCD subunit D C-terminal domain-containing protein, partial [Candidatus Bathyarchaeia archaeon]|nr:exonuclease SbcCD subunit D C-terminal domain-containing protein [Candidatus Bathyarchaeia archaeon]
AGSWIDLELHVKEAIDPAEFQRLRKLSDDFIKIQRVLVQEGKQDEREQPETKKEELRPDQLFRRFFERKRGVSPDEKVVELFARLMAQVQDREAGGERE